MEKKIVILLLLLKLDISTQAQDCPVSKGQTENITFETYSEGTTIQHCFVLDGNKVGPSIIFTLDAIEYCQYNRKGVKDGFFVKIIHGERLLGTYDDGIEKGAFFNITNSGELIEAYELDKRGNRHAKDQLYKQNKRFGYGLGNTTDGFGKVVQGNTDEDEFGNAYLGYWSKDTPDSPHQRYYFEDRNLMTQYEGSYSGWKRDGFAAFTWHNSDGNLFLGYYNKDKTYGLGIYLLEGHTVDEAGWYTKGYDLEIDLNN